MKILTIWFCACLGLAGWGLSAALAATPPATPTELLRQGVIAEETSKSSDTAAAFYQKAVEAGEPQRVATATALSRLGELEWRGGKTNDAIRTWRLLEAQYADQTNLIQLARERVPLRLTATTVEASRDLAKPELSAAARAAANIGQLDQLPENQWPVWLSLQGVSPSGLMQLTSQGNRLGEELERLATEFSPNHEKVVAAQRAFDISRKQLAKEVESVVGVLRLMAVPASSGTAKPTDTAIERDLGNPEEQTELARVQRLWRDSPDLLTAVEPNKIPGSPLETAAHSGYTRVLDFLVAKNVALKGTRALSLAAWAGQLAAVQQLVRAGADPNDPAGFATPLLCAVARGHRRVVEALIQAGAKVDLPSPYTASILNYPSPSSGPLGFSAWIRPVHGAVVNRTVNTLQLLAESGADLNASDWQGQRPLHLAARSGSPELITFLMSKKVDPNPIDKSGNTPLTTTGITAVQSLLLEAGADPNLFPSVDKSPLWEAVRRRDTDLIALLIDKGAHVDIKRDSTTLLDLAIGTERSLSGGFRTLGDSGSEPPSDAYLRTRRTVCELLLKAGARIASKGKRMLQLTVESGDPELVALALRFGEKPDEPDDTYPPLLDAVNRNLRMVELLVAAGADPNKRGLNGTSAFEQARNLALHVNPFSPAVQIPDSDRMRVLELLAAKGGRSFFSTFNTIGFASDLTNSLGPVFTATPVSGEREFTLAELLDQRLLKSLEPGQQDRTSMPWYPDLAGAYLYNDLDRTQPPRKKALDLAALIEAGDFGKNLRLEWGDILVVPKRARQGDEQPYVLPAARAEALSQAMRRIIVVNASGLTVQLIFERGKLVAPDTQGFAIVANSQYPVVRSVALAAANLTKAKFHSRFRVVRRGESAPIDRVFRFDASFSPTPAIPTPRLPQPGVPQPRPLPLPVPLGAQANPSPAPADEFADGESFVLQDGDIVTLYALPKP